jgi:deferrochelatase/peroxidase EfeB
MPADFALPVINPRKPHRYGPDNPPPGKGRTPGQVNKITSDIKRGIIEAATLHGADDHVRNDFLYYYKDRFGLACPIGALRLSKMHRIIRRGRPYERRTADKEGADGQRTEKGMLFIALNADIAGQFEMIQHSWLNNPHFNGLYSGTDPISHYADQGGDITIQSRPTTLHIKRPAPFVRVRGGAYFFLPGIRALRQIAPSA